MEFHKKDRSKISWDRIKEKWIPGSKSLTCLKAYTSKTTERILNLQHLAVKIKPIFLENRLFLSLIPSWIFTYDGINFCSSEDVIFIGLLGIKKYFAESFNSFILSSLLYSIDV